MSEKFLLKWNDYQSNWNKAIKDLRKDTDFADVTLISDDKVKFTAHKIILSSCSDTFKFILQGNTNAKPLLYLGGVSSINLGFILDYIYHGEVNLFQEQLDSFLESAQKLEIEGLLENKQEDQEDGAEHFNENMNVQEQMQKNTEYRPKFNENSTFARMEENPVVEVQRDIRRNANDLGKKIDVSSMTEEEIEKKIKELYQKVDGTWRCIACDYSTRKNSSKIRMHVETHLNGLSYTCPSCNKEFRSRNSLYVHKHLKHK